MKQQCCARKFLCKIAATAGPTVLERFMEPVFKTLVAGLVDRMKNLLAPIKANAQYLLTDAIATLSDREIPGVDVSEMKSAMDDALAGVRKIEELVAAFGLFEEAVQHTVRKTSFPVDEIVRMTLNSVRALAAEHGVTLEVDPSLAVLGEIPVYPFMVQKALTHLIRNAIEGVDKKHPTKIVISVTRADEVVTFHVWDNGPGFPQKMRTQVFVPFQTEGKGFDRHGLGLAYVTVAARLHGGSFEVETTPGVGTKASVTLPLHSKTATLAMPPRNSRPRVTAPHVQISVNSGSLANQKLAKWLLDPAGKILAGALKHYVNNALSYARSNVEYVCGALGQLPAGSFDTRVMENVERIGGEVYEAVATVQRNLNDFLTMLDTLKSEKSEWVSVRVELDQSLKRVRESFPESEVTVQVDDRKQEIGNISLMHGPFSQMLDAIFANAFEAARTARESGQVQVEIGQAGDEIIIRIANNGSSITDSIFPRIFYPFVSLGKPGASGMGLTHALLAAHLLGAKIEVVSGDGRTQVEIRIPNPPTAQS